MTADIRGKVKLRMPARRIFVSACLVAWALWLLTECVVDVQTAQAMPCSRWIVGKTSAEYWKATGPSPKEYMMVKRQTNLMSCISQD